ncbi:hypothetical protein BJ875DRAFT_474467, partial [Amylocarpus encephaloides]
MFCTCKLLSVIPIVNLAMGTTTKLIAVIGATGNQGSSVAHTFLALPNWYVRCVTRNPESSASKSLESLGAEIVKADLSHQPSLSKAFEGAHAIFVNTDFWGSYRANEATTSPSENGKSVSEKSYEQEVSYGKNAAVAAAAVPTLERFVYSALGPAGKHSKGKYASAHWDSKAAIVEFIEQEQSDLAKKTSFIYLGGYVDNPNLTPRLDPVTGKHMLVLPFGKETMMPIVDPKASTGPFVKALVEDKNAGVKLLAYDDFLSVGEFVDMWSKANGKEAKFIEMGVQDMCQQFGLTMETLNGACFIGEYGYTGGIQGIIEPSHLKTRS